MKARREPCQTPKEQLTPASRLEKHCPDKCDPRTASEVATATQVLKACYNHLQPPLLLPAAM